jgi:hypothetical protein
VWLDACFYYNSKDTNSDEFGYGWRNSLRSWLEEPSGTSADIYRGDGTVLHYTDLDGMTGYYPPPAGVRSKLKKLTTMPQSWTETTEDGFTYEYDSSGDLTKMQNVGGATWTLSYTGTCLGVCEHVHLGRDTYYFVGHLCDVDSNSPYTHSLTRTEQ